jgi:hypothetical protein
MHDVTMTHKNKKNKQFLKRGFFLGPLQGSPDLLREAVDLKQEAVDLKQ